MADDTNIQDATGSSYTLTENDEGKAITVTVSFTDAEGNPEMLTSNPTGEVAAAPAQNIPATGVPTISGTLQVGETLTADTAGMSTRTGWTTSPSATSGWLTTRTFRARRTLPTPSPRTTRARPSRCSCPSPTPREPGDPAPALRRMRWPQRPLRTVRPPAQPTISGTAQVGQTLTADTTGIADADGLDHRFRTATSGWLTTTNIQGASERLHLHPGVRIRRGQGPSR